MIIHVLKYKYETLKKWILVIIPVLKYKYESLNPGVTKGSKYVNLTNDSKRVPILDQGMTWPLTGNHLEMERHSIQKIFFSRR